MSEEGPKEMTLKTTKIDRDNYLLTHEVEKVSDLPEWAEVGTYIFVKEKGWLYVFDNNHTWLEFVPEDKNSAGYANYQRLQLQRAKTRRITKEEEEITATMMIAHHEPTYGKKALPEVIGKRTYVDPYWRAVPVVFGVFGVEMVIGTIDIDKEKNPEPKVIARNYEKDEDRIRVNVSNFLLFLDEKYCRVMETPNTATIAYDDNQYRVKVSLSEHRLQVDRKKRFFWKPILSAVWKRSSFEEITSPMQVLNYEMKDTDIPTMADLVAKMLDKMDDTLKKRQEAKEKAEKEVLEAKEAKKIYYDMLGI